MKLLDLNGAWQLQEAGQTEIIPARVPGCVHEDLLRAGKIEAPFYRDNEDRLQWISEKEWVYSRSFEVSAAFLAHDRVRLCCDGLDTMAEVTLNGRPVAVTDNMFRTWAWEVKDRLQTGTNTIVIHFKSPLPYIREQQARRPLPGWNGPKEMKGRGWVRKEPCNFGWDWGPVLITAGIWRNLRLMAFNTARLNSVQVRQDHGVPGQVTLRCGLAVEQLNGAPVTAAVRVLFAGAPVAEAQVPIAAGMAQEDMAIADPQLWWPNGKADSVPACGVLPSSPRAVRLRCSNKTAQP